MSLPEALTVRGGIGQLISSGDQIFWTREGLYLVYPVSWKKEGRERDREGGMKGRRGKNSNIQNGSPTLGTVHQFKKHLLAAPHGMQDPSPPTRDRTHASCAQCGVLTTGPPGRVPLHLHFVNLPMIPMGRQIKNPWSIDRVGHHILLLDLCVVASFSH